MTDLEKEISEWLKHGHITDTRLDDYNDDDIIETAKHFTEWQKEQDKKELMREAIPAKVAIERHDGTGVWGNVMSDFIALDRRGLELGDEVKIIVLEKRKGE